VVSVFRRANRSLTMFPSALMYALFLPPLLSFEARTRKLTSPFSPFLLSLSTLSPLSLNSSVCGSCQVRRAVLKRQGRTRTKVKKGEGYVYLCFCSRRLLLLYTGISALSSLPSLSSVGVRTKERLFFTLSPVSRRLHSGFFRQPFASFKHDVQRLQFHQRSLNRGRGRVALLP
jgi:hypothetical protein